MKRFEDSPVWQKSKELAVATYKAFHETKDFSFRDQIQRAALSISNNIAEGFERNSDKEFKQFLFVAKASCGEVRSMLAVAFELGYIDQATKDPLTSNCLEISKMLSGFIKALSLKP